MRRWGRVEVVGDSMRPTLRPGDRLLVRWGAAPQPGGLCVARPPGSTLLTVKRAVFHDGQGWWLQGDAGVGRSEDSRVYGSVPDGAVLGRVLLRYWPAPRPGGRLRPPR